MMFKMSRFVGVAALVVAINAFCAVPPEKAKAIEKKIAEELKTTVDKLVDEKELAKRFGFEHPVLAPKMTLAAVQAIVDDRIRQLAEKKYPNSWVNVQLNKESDRFRPWMEGDKVKGKTRDGKEFSGWLRDKTNTTIQVNALKIRIADLDQESLLHVDDKRARIAREQARVKLRKSLRAHRQRYMREIRLEKVREVYHQEGYIRVKGRWMPKIQFFQERVKIEQERYTKLLKTPLSYKHYYEAGYRQFKDDWFTPEEVVKLRELARIEEELNPTAMMAEFDLLNKEGFEGTTNKDVKKIFGDDDDDDDEKPKKDAKPKKDEKPKEGAKPKKGKDPIDEF